MQVSTLANVGLQGHRLKFARERLGLSQGDFAEAMGAPQQHVSRWENGHVDPNSYTLKAMARLLQVSSDYLLGLTEDLNDPAELAGLPPLKRKLLWMVDNGQIVEAIQTLTGLKQSKD